MIHRLFVYGSLAPGQLNGHVLADVPGEWEPATVTGTLFQEGWGAAMGYPGIVLDERGDEVEGLLFHSEHLGRCWDRLDAFEGEGYERAMTRAKLRDGSVVDACIYTLRGNALRPVQPAAANDASGPKPPRGSVGSGR
jgi:gamma-glutamylcyclotransferase (GGCT)/AIG2-like uncharacterized protein YtfP